MLTMRIIAPLTHLYLPLLHRRIQGRSPAGTFQEASWFTAVSSGRKKERRSVSDPPSVSTRRALQLAETETVQSPILILFGIFQLLIEFGMADRAENIHRETDVGTLVEEFNHFFFFFFRKFNLIHSFNCLSSQSFNSTKIRKNRIRQSRPSQSCRSRRDFPDYPFETLYRPVIRIPSRIPGKSRRDIWRTSEELVGILFMPYCIGRLMQGV